MIFDDIEPAETHTTSKAVVVNGKSKGIVLWWSGTRIEMEVDEGGLEELGDLGLDDAPFGVSIWEGDFYWERGGFEHPEDGDMHPKGKFRQPTADEWSAIQKQESPFK